MKDEREFRVVFIMEIPFGRFQSCGENKSRTILINIKIVLYDKTNYGMRL